MKNYTVGIDYGTLSARIALVDCDNGQEVGSKELCYPHGVLEKSLPDGTPLPSDWALQVPADYMLAITQTLPELIKESGIEPESIKGVGVDFTSCTIIPVTSDGTPLCELEEYKSYPHAYAKLWKHHGAQDEADLINRVAEERGEKWFTNYGSRISCEFAYPKILQTLNEAPEIYEKSDYFIDAGDWIVWKLCGTQVRSACIAGFKYFYNENGYPSKEFNMALDKRLENLVSHKLNAPIAYPGEKAGEITCEMSRITGLKEGTPVSCAVIDAHGAAPALKITRPGRMFAILGTSACFIVMDEKTVFVPGIFGLAHGATMSGYVSYEAGLSGYGDCFNWVAENIFPEKYAAEAREKRMNAHQLLTEKASCLRIGESGLIALDWLNGNRSVLNDSKLSGMIVGLTLSTKPEEIYRAFLEATAFSIRVIIEAFEKSGISVSALYASGGIAVKNPFLIQMLSDVLKKPIYISSTTQGGAVGSAIYAAATGVYNGLCEAAEKMGSLREEHYEPNGEDGREYDKLYDEFIRLHDLFGKDKRDIMYFLKELKG